MTVDGILQVLNFLFTPGCVTALLVWIKTKDNRKAAASKERNDAYKQMYDNLSGTLLDLQNENIKLYKAVRDLNRTIQKAVACPHYRDCPMRGELQGTEEPDRRTDIRPVRQPAKRKKNTHVARDNPRKPGQPESADGQRVPSSDGGTVHGTQRTGIGAGGA
ncbi:hypothetical protein [Phocaeicola faecalis]